MANRGQSKRHNKSKRRKMATRYIPTNGGSRVSNKIKKLSRKLRWAATLK